MELAISGRTAIVLGATSGLGWAVAEGLAGEGVQLVLVARDAAQVAERASLLPSAVGVVADLTEPDAPARIAAAAREAYGDVDILVLNGGGPAPGTASTIGAGEVDAAVDLLLKPHVALVQELLGDMTTREWGRIIAIGSSGVQQPIPNLALSNIGRAALAGYLKTLASEVAGSGVTVNMVLPGRIDTARVAQLDRAAAGRTGTTPEAARQASEATIPVGRYGTPEEFAAVAVFLAGQPAAFVTGEQVRCDGGLLRSH